MAESTKPAHVTLAVVLQVRSGKLQVLLWQRAQGAVRGRLVPPGRAISSPARRSRTRSASIWPRRSTSASCRTSSSSRPAASPTVTPREWQLATAYLGVVPLGVDPALPDDTDWHPVDRLPKLAFDHREITLAGRERLRAKLSYTNIGFALAPETFTMRELRDVYAAALGHDVSTTNLHRVLRETRACSRPPASGGARAHGRPSCRAIPLQHAGARGDRSVRGAAPARLAAADDELHGEAAPSDRSAPR